MTATISLGPKADCIYGRSGSTKTTQVGHLAEYIHEKYGKVTRLVSADPGGWQSVEHLVQAGLIVPVNLNTSSPFPLERLIRLAQGWWPLDTADPTSKLQPTKDMSTIGAVAFEGMSTFSILIMSDLLKRTDTIHIPETAKESFVKDVDMKWGFSGRAHYGFIQQRIYEAVTTSNHLPVHKVLWTAHETDGKDSRKQTVNGPQIIGEAMTGQCGAWFGAMLHLMSVEKQESVVDPLDKAKKITVIHRRPIMFLREHIDPADPYKVPFMAKPRGPSNLWQEWHDYMEPNIGDFYRKLDDMGDRALAAIRAKAGGAR